MISFLIFLYLGIGTILVYRATKMVEKITGPHVVAILFLGVLWPVAMIIPFLIRTDFHSTKR